MDIKDIITEAEERIAKDLPRVLFVAGVIVRLRRIPSKTWRAGFWRWRLERAKSKLNAHDRLLATQLANRVR